MTGSVHALGAEAVGLAEPLGHRLGTLERDVGHHDLRKGSAPLSDRGKRRPHAARPNHQDSHAISVTQIRHPGTAQEDLARTPQRTYPPAARQQRTAPICCPAPMASCAPATRPSPPPAAARAMLLRWAPSPSLGRAELLWIALAGVAPRHPHELAAGAAPAQPHRPRSRRPGAHRLADRLGRPRDAAQPAAPVQRQRLLPPPAEPRLLGFAARLRPGGVLRARARSPRSSATTCCSSSRGRCASSAPTCWRASSVSAGSPPAPSGVAFAYAPYRVTEAGHLHVISSGGIPLALFLLLRGYRRSARELCWRAGWWPPGRSASASRWVCSSPTCWRSWRRWRSSTGGGLARPALPRQLVAVTLAGMAVVGIVTIYQARPYLKVSHDYPTAKRTIKEVKNYSAGPAALLAASSENRVWGGATAGMRAKVHSKNESVFFPGGLILVLALIGAWRGSAGRGNHIRGDYASGWPSGSSSCSILALGFGPDRRRLPLPPYVRLRPGLERRASARQGLHDGDALLRAAGRRGRAAARRTRLRPWG